MLVDGIISDITAREEAAARLAEASDRFTSLLDVVGAHVYLALALPDGSAPGAVPGPRRRPPARRRGARPRDGELGRGRAPRRSAPRTTPSTEALGRGEDADVTYRLIGADGITRWVHDRGACRPRPDGTFEVSGIVSDVTERRRLEDDLQRSMREMQIAHRELERARAEAELRAGTDELTGTFNRRHFAQIATESLASHARPLRPAPARRRPLQADQRRLRPCRRRRRPGRPRPPAALRARARRLPGPLGRRGVRRAPARRGLRPTSSPAGRTLPPRRQRDADRRTRTSGSSSRSRSAARSHPTTARASTRSSTRPTLPLRGQAPGPKPRLAPARQHRRGARRPASPRSVGMARALAFASSLREGIPEEHAEQVATLAGADGRAPRPARSRRPALPARRLAARRRQARGARADPDQARPARRRRVGDHAHASRCRSGHRPPRGRPAARPRPPSATTTSATPAAATPTASPATPSPSRRASSPPPTPTRR